MVKRCMRKFDAPLSRHGWCQIWCKDVRNHLASRKLNWQTPTERLLGETPDISVFRFHFWEPIEFYDHTVKQPNDGWMPGRFLGIAWESGDAMTYYIEPETALPHHRNRILIRSTVRSRKRKTLPSSFTPIAGEPTTSTQETDFSFENKVANEEKDEEPPNEPNLQQNEIKTHNDDAPPELAPDDSAIADEQVLNTICRTSGMVG